MKNVSIEFGGFYESEHSERVNSMIDDYFDVCDYFNTNINYDLIHNEYSKNYVLFLNEFLKDNYDLDVKMVFTNLDKPKQYNYRTDYIDADISEDGMSKIIDLFSKDDKCISYINEASMSRSGFVSFYSGINEVKKEEDIHIQYIFKYINTLVNEDYNQYYDFNNLYELLYGLDFISKVA